MRYSYFPNANGGGSNRRAQNKSSQWEGLKSLLDKSSAKIIAWQVPCGMEGSSAAIRRVTNPPDAKKAAALPEAGGLTWASEVYFHEIGSTLKLRLPDSSVSRFDGLFKGV